MTKAFISGIQLFCMIAGANRFAKGAGRHGDFTGGSKL